MSAKDNDSELEYTESNSLFAENIPWIGVSRDPILRRSNVKSSTSMFSV